MADSELLLQPEMLAELKRYRAAERRLQASRQHDQEFKELARQVAPGDATPLSTPLRDGSPAAELAATHSALRQQIAIIYKLEAELNEQMRAPRRPPPNPSRPQPFIQENIKIALWVVSGVVVFLLLLTLLHSVVMH